MIIGIGNYRFYWWRADLRLENIICHIDVNSAFLSWTAVDRLHRLPDSIDIRETPAVIGGDQQTRRGIVLASSIVAKSYGVKTGEPLFQALHKCPHLAIYAPDYELYVHCSARLMDLLQKVAPVVEQYSIDEAWIDLTGTDKLYGDPVRVATLLKDRIRDELGFTVNIGISTNKLLAKMASDFLKPDRVHTLFPDELAAKLWPLPVGKLFFVGPATEKKLLAMGILTIGDLAKADVRHLRSRLHKHGEIIWHYANGRCFDVVASQASLNKGYGNSTTTALDIIDITAAHKVLLSLSETVGARMRRDNQYGSCLTLHLRSSQFHDFSHQLQLAYPTNLTLEIYQAACLALNQLWDKHTPLRQLGIYMSKVDHYGLRQGSLFTDDNYTKLSQVDKTVDKIREKFGSDAIFRACLAEKNIRPMSGGPLSDPFRQRSRSSDTRSLTNDIKK